MSWATGAIARAYTGGGLRGCAPAGLWTCGFMVVTSMIPFFAMAASNPLGYFFGMCLLWLAVIGLLFAGCGKTGVCTGGRGRDTARRNGNLPRRSDFVQRSMERYHS